MNELIEKLGKLLDAATLACREAATYYARQNGSDVPSGLAEAEAAAAAPRKERKPRAKKEESAEMPPAMRESNKQPEAAPAAAPAATTAQDLSEPDTLAECYKAAGAYVNLDTDAGKIAGRQAAAKAHMQASYKLGSIKELAPAQRVQMTSWFKQQVALAKGNGVAA